MQKTAGSGGRIVRVAHLSSGHHADDARVFWKECLSLARTGGYDVSLTIPEEHPSRLPGLPRDVQVTVVRNRPGRLGRLLVMPWPLLAAGLRRNAAIYQVHDPELLFVALLLRLLGRKVIYDAHEDVPRDILAKIWVPVLLRRLLAGGAGAFEWFAGRTLSGVIAATPVIAQRFPAGRTALVQNFARISEFPAASASVTQGPPAIAYVGGITVDRCAPEMVEAVARLERFPGARLIMAGGIHPPGLAKTLAAMPGWRCVDYRGIQDRPGVLRILAEAHIGLVLFHPLQNYEEAQPVKLYEYMAAGLPVVATNLPRLRETVEGHRCGICVPPRDVAATTRAIEWLLDHRTEAEEMGRRGREAAMKFFSWESEERTLIEFYRRIAGPSGAGSPGNPPQEADPAGISQDEARRIRTVYVERERLLSGTRKADDSNPGNMALVREARGRLGCMLRQRLAKPLPECRILDLGCGTGKLLTWLQEQGVPGSRLFGVDLVPSRIDAARQALPACHFQAANAERLDFPDGWFDLVCVFMVFSSVLDRGMELNLARTIRRLLAPNGAVVWYDTRYPNPWNPSLKAMPRRRIEELFPDFSMNFETVGLLPQLARRLGALTGRAYPVLSAFPPLRTHLLGLLKPATEADPGFSNA